MITIDEEFKNLIPPLAYEERTELEKSLLDEGCRDALVLWGDILIDGHNRYEICTKYHIPYNTVKREFTSRDDVIAWIINNQFARRNISKLQRAELALRLKPVIAEKAKEKQLSALKQNATVSQKSVERLDTQKELAKIAGVSHDTIAKTEVILEKAPAPVIEAAKSDKLSVNAAYQVTKLAPEQQREIARRIENISDESKETSTPKAIVQEVVKRPHVSYNSGNNEWYTPAEIIEAARLVMGSIDIDPASNDDAQKVVKAGTYYTAETNGLDKEWAGNVWLNPPYASELIGKFIDKLLAERINFKQAIVLVNNATETEWFSKIVKLSSAVCFPRSRVKFYKADGTTGAPLQGQAILYIGDNIDAFISAFKGMGWIAKVV